MSVLREGSGTRALTIGAAVIVCAIVVALVVDLASQSSFAAGNTVDGKIDPGEYAEGFRLALFGVDPSGNPVCSASAPCGTIHMEFDGSTVYGAFEYKAISVGPDGIVGTSDDPVINENVFGPQGQKNGPPGYHDLYQTGWGNRDFGKLLHSDGLRTNLFCSSNGQFDFNNPEFDWTQDYLEATGNPSNPWNSPTGYGSGANR